MTSFSERNGYVSVRDVLQTEDLDERTRIDIYNVIRRLLGEYGRESLGDCCAEDIWTDFWHKPLDDCPEAYYRFYKKLIEYLKECEWFRIFDLVEFLASEFGQWDAEANEKSRYAAYCPGDRSEVQADFSEAINDVLEKDCVGYRLIAGVVASVVSEVEVASIEQAVGLPLRFEKASGHIGKALALFGDRSSPDYQNAIKESICAVEAAVGIMLSDEGVTMGKGIKRLGDSLLMHGALVAGWEKLYGFTSDASGIRHSGKGIGGEPDANMARYMLVTCSAFVNYLVALDGAGPSKSASGGTQ